MKKLIILLLLIFLSPPVYADYQQSLKDYSFQFEQYRNVHQVYSVSKNKYLSYKTPLALAEALESGKNVIQLRDMVLITYLTSIKDKFDDTKDIPPEDLVTYGALLDEKISFLSSHKDKTKSTISLYDLTNVSKEVESIQDELNILSRKIVGTILIARLEGLKNNIDKDQDFLSFTVSQNKANLSSAVNLERWLIESENKMMLSGEKIDQAREVFKNMYRPSEDFNKGQLLLISANQYLKEALNFQSEIVKGIAND